jgi:hypothetical protein
VTFAGTLPLTHAIRGEMLFSRGSSIDCSFPLCDFPGKASDDPRVEEEFLADRESERGILACIVMLNLVMQR